MTDQPEKRRLSAIMFSDICGYSRIMGSSENRAMRILKLHNELMDSAMGKFGGHIIKRMGDGILAEFHSAVSAVECAIAIQRSVREYSPTWEESDRFQLRIGVHLGDVIVSGDDILGDGVNVASRIEPLAEPGGICISQDIFNLVHNKVEMQTISLGPQQLKNISRQVGIFRILLEAAEQEVSAGVPKKIISRDKYDGLISQPGSDSGNARSLKIFWISAAVILLLFGLVFAGKASKKKKEQLCINTAIQQADVLLSKNDARQARTVLEQARQAVRPTTPGLTQLHERLARVRDMELTEQLRKRFDEFKILFVNKDWKGCANLVDMANKTKYGTEGLSQRFAIAGIFVAIAQIKPDDYRIRSIRLSEDRLSAEVIPELNVRNEWKEQPPAKWRFSDNDWFIVVE